jgi:hypothetical protein
MTSTWNTQSSRAAATYRAMGPEVKRSAVRNAACHQNAGVDDALGNSRVACCFCRDRALRNGALRIELIDWSLYQDTQPIALPVI